MAENMAENDSADERDIEQRIYEFGFHLISSLSEEEVLPEFSMLKRTVEECGGAPISEEYPHRQALAYSISRRTTSKTEVFDHSYFGWIKFEMPSQSILAFKKAIDDNKAVLRFIIVHSEREVPQPKRQIHKEHAVLPKQEQETAKKTISEEELDRTIDELVVE